MYEVLKDEAKRARYDQILEHGLPDWRQPIFYFRRVRKLSMHELAIALSIIISIGHYFVMWAQYFEKKLTLVNKSLNIFLEHVRKASVIFDHYGHFRLFNCLTSKYVDFLRQLIVLNLID